jgi:hypothetical protein
VKVKANIGVVGNIAFTCVILAVISWALLEARTWPYEARILPLIIGTPAAALCLAIIAQDLWNLWRPKEARSKAMLMDIQVDQDQPLGIVVRRATMMFAWVFGFFGVTWLLGFLISVPLFVFLYLLVQGGERWWVAAIASVSMFVFTVGVFHFVIHVSWIRGAIPGPQREMIELLNKLY